MRLVLAIALLAAAVGACETSDDTASLPADLAAAARDRWEEVAPPHYRIVYSMQNLNGMGGSHGDGLYDAIVADGRVVSCVSELNLQPSQVNCDPPVPNPVSVLFAAVARYDPDHTTVEFDPEWGFPSSLFYDVPGISDEEYQITVHLFEVLDS